MNTESVKFFNVNRGFGFIQPDGPCKDAFVHITAVGRAGLNHLIEGQKIQFDLVVWLSDFHEEDARVPATTRRNGL